MSYQALARKYRPQTFRDLLGQETIVRTLRNSIEQKRIHHAFLFSGVRGVGKTSTARILAKALNCVKGPTIEPCNACDPCREITEGIDLDVREIDAATYTQVDNIRELREVSQFQPARDRYRIFIIDEAHMLSQGAWNALLKLVEEPPPHVIFMMATTEMQKVPATILSRVQQFTFRRITRDELADRLAEICTEEGIEADRDALLLIAERGDGSVRDSLSILDQMIAFSGRSFSAPEVADTLGLADDTFFDAVAEKVLAGDTPGILESLQRAAEEGRDFKLLYRDFMGYLRTLLLIRSGARVQGTVLTPGAAAIAERFEPTELLRLLNVLLRDDETIARTEQQRLAVEIAFLKAAALPKLRSVEAVLRGDGGDSPGAPTPQRTPPNEAAPAAPARQQSPKTGSPVSRALEMISAERRILATYLQDSAITVEGSSVTIHVPAANPVAVSLIQSEDAKTIIRSAFSQVIGGNAEVQVASAEAAPEKRSEPAATPQTEDPVLRSLQRHLGGEVVQPRPPRNQEA